MRLRPARLIFEYACDSFGCVHAPKGCVIYNSRLCERFADMSYLQSPTSPLMCVHCVHSHGRVRPASHLRPPPPPHLSLLYGFFSTFSLLVFTHLHSVNAQYRVGQEHDDIAHDRTIKSLAFPYRFSTFTGLTLLIICICALQDRARAR